MPRLYIDDVIAEKEAELDRLQQAVNRAEGRTQLANLLTQLAAVRKHLDDLIRNRDSGIYERRPSDESPDDI